MEAEALSQSVGVRRFGDSALRPGLIQAQLLLAQREPRKTPKVAPTPLLDLRGPPAVRKCEEVEQREDASKSEKQSEIDKRIERHQEEKHQYRTQKTQLLSVLAKASRAPQNDSFSSTEPLRSEEKPIQKKLTATTLKQALQKVHCLSSSSEEPEPIMREPMAAERAARVEAAARAFILIKEKDVKFELLLDQDFERVLKLRRGW